MSLRGTMTGTPQQQDFGSRLVEKHVSGECTAAAGWVMAR